MSTRFLLALVLALMPALAAAQAPPPPPPPGLPPPPPPGVMQTGAAQFSQPELDQLLAPVALYPDPLLSEILMAATYPLEIVEASRWLQEADHAQLRGDVLANALNGQNWDPSVKSLVPFPQVLQQMNDRLDWTERVGDAFLAQQGDVMDSVQRLRQRAQAAGYLQSSPQEMVQAQGSTMMIEPTQPDVVYVPYYDPNVVYGGWPWGAYPPDYFEPGVGLAFGGAIGFSMGVPIVGPYWGWNHFDWQRHQIAIQRQAIGPATQGGVWQHDPDHRHMVPYRNDTVRERFGGATPQRPATPSAMPAQNFREPVAPQMAPHQEMMRPAPNGQTYTPHQYVPHASPNRPANEQRGQSERDRRN